MKDETLADRYGAGVEKAGWRTIESAPKDGTEVLGCFAFKVPGGVYRIGWVADGYLDGDEWVFSSFPLDADEYSAPTHWMPLPTPPHGGSDDR